MWILRVETELAYRHPTLAQLFAALSPILREQLHSSPFANLESYLAEFSMSRLDHQSNHRIGWDRLLRLALQAVLARLRQSQWLTISAPLPMCVCHRTSDVMELVRPCRS